jgi:UDP-2,4-diacetamido-2,4,6-trideoxy-beta-L-altropyranose hydrolase
MVMKVAIRVDASLKIGSGHVMRCLTLADALRSAGAQCLFVCRSHPGNLIQKIREKHLCAELPISEKSHAACDAQLESSKHSNWLGCSWEVDAIQTSEVLRDFHADWLVVDHYALDQHWEAAMQGHYKKLMVIDDLSDRAHSCDLLLDQNWLGNDTVTRYKKLVPTHCECYLGPEYALLRPEYAHLREILPPRGGRLGRILLFMGGSDPTNETGKVLEALMNPALAHLEVDVVLGPNHPNVEGIRAQVTRRPDTTVYQDLPTLAELMAHSDLMISAGGSTTWERMCLGLPAIVISIASNQTKINDALMEAGYIDFLGVKSEVSVANISDAIRRYVNTPIDLLSMSKLCYQMVTGTGTSIICHKMFEGSGVQNVT